MQRTPSQQSNYQLTNPNKSPTLNCNNIYTPDYSKYNLLTPNTNNQQNNNKFPNFQNEQYQQEQQYQIPNFNQLNLNNKTSKQGFQRKGTIQPKSTYSNPQYKEFETERKQTFNFHTNINQLQEQNQPSLTENDIVIDNQSESEDYSSLYTKQQLDYRISCVQNLWQYRYVTYLQQGVYRRNWMKLFSFLGEYKQKCINLLKKLVNSSLKAYKQLQDIDYRSNMKNQGQQGIYLIDGIIIRIARIKNKENKQIDQMAVKALHQEYLAYNILNNLSVSTLKDQNFENFKVPLTCLVKYLGYTALCQADTPCQGLETLIHGPTATIYQYREESVPLLKKIGEQLNLKEFKMLSKDGKVLTIPFSLTIQLHRVTRKLKSDNMIHWFNPKSVLYPRNGTFAYEKPEYYLSNARKLWPLFIDSDIMKSSGYLRPQVVLGWKTKLSNTVFSKIAYKQDPSSELQLADACKTLKEDNIKILAKMLDNTTIFLVDSQGIQDIMHQYGVNIRFMGQLAKKVTLQFSKKVLEGQMIARTCKKYFFPIFHQVLADRKVKQPVSCIKQIFVDFLNLLFIRNDQGKKFYKKYVYEKIQTYYEYQIKDYPPNITGGGLLHALSYHFGIKVKVIDYPFFQEGVDLIFNTSHITDIVGFAKIFDMQTSQIKLICKKFKQKRKQNKLYDCIPELKILGAINKCLNHQKTHNLGPFKQSYYYAQLAEIYFSINEFQLARQYAELSLKGIPEKHADAIKPFSVLVKYYSVKKQINRCIEYYQKSLGYLNYHLSPQHPLSINVYNTLGYEFVNNVDPAKCEKIFMKSFQICEQALGYMHHTSSQILLQLANLPLPPQKTINFLLQSLTILQNLNQHQTLIKQVSMRISQQYSKLGNIQKMIVYARKSGHWRNEIRGQDKLSNDKFVFQLTNRVANSTQQTQFLIFYAVKSYLRTLERLSKQTLYKVFVTYKQLVMDKQKAKKSLFKRMTQDRSNINNCSDFVRNNFVIIVRDMCKKLPKHHFYITDIQEWDRSLKNLLEIFIQIISTIGLEDMQDMFLSYNKTF